MIKVGITKSEALGLAVVAALTLAMVLWRQHGSVEPAPATTVADAPADAPETPAADAPDAGARSLAVSGQKRVRKGTRKSARRQYADRNPLNDTIVSP